ncbi:hypothetical protein [Rhodococcoides fascians]|uniref:hypothetical protein n=1 Tax=Rhodococcoides fascians TaxID=1828 RepID=UPI000B224E24|nr:MULTISPECIES: hypothetical protein [Rhodococcus]
MTDGNTFTPPADEGQAGWVLLPDGRYGYRYEGSDDVIIHNTREDGSGYDAAR